MDRDVIERDGEHVCAHAGLAGIEGARVLLTGASGLIGSCFLASLSALKQTGHRVEVYAQALSELPAHTRRLVDAGQFQILRANLADFGDYASLPEADVIIHGAGYAQPLRYMSNPGGTLQVNTAGTLALLQRLRPGGHFLYMSSVAVYTGLDDVECGEDAVGTTTPAHPRASYIEGKRAGEAVCHAYRAQGVHATAVRLGDVYGPGTRAHDRRALNSFIERACTEGVIRLLDDGSAIRSYCYVSDAVEVMWRILLEGRDTVYNVGGHGLTTIGAVATAIGRLTGASVVPGPPDAGVAGAPAAIRLDLNRVDREFGWTERVGLDDGLAATVAWQRRLYDAA